MAGFSAAVALKKKNKQVAVIAKTGGASSVSSGAWDFGRGPQETWPDQYRRALVDAPEIGNPEDVTAAAQDVATALAKDLKLSFSFKKPYVLPTSSGTWKRCAGAQEIQVRGDLNNIKSKKIGVVASEHWRFRADLVLKKWAAEAESQGTRLDLTPLWLDLPLKGADWPLSHIGARLAADETFRKQFLESLERRHHGSNCETLLFPPLFADPAFFDTVQKTLKVQAAECLATVEPVAGLRLTNAIRRALERLQIPLIFVSDVKAEMSDSFVRQLQIVEKGSEAWRAVSAQGYVLATGKFFGGGVDLGYHRLRETVFGLPLFHSRSDGPVANRSELNWDFHPFPEEQPWARLGTWADAKWRPRDTTKNPVLKNVVVCGSNLGGVDFAKESLGLGFMAYTGRQSANVLH